MSTHDRVQQLIEDIQDIGDDYLGETKFKVISGSLRMPQSLQPGKIYDGYKSYDPETGHFWILYLDTIDNVHRYALLGRSVVELSPLELLAREAL